MDIRTLFKITPNTANTRENPRTKYTVFKNIFNLVAFFSLRNCPDESCISLSVVPDRYAIKAGKTGKMHGEKKDPAPASAEMSIAGSTIPIVTPFWINTFVQINTRFITNLKSKYYLSIYSSYDNSQKKIGD
jgi:hypothetical protein